MDDGLRHKFHVSRVDGRDEPGEKHDGCRYFVLDPKHDSDAREALAEYAYRCRYRNQKLSDDLYDWLNEIDDL